MSNTRQLEIFPHLTNPVDRTIEMNAVRFYTNQCFAIPTPLANQYMKQYFLVYWRGSFILEQMREGYISRKTSQDNRLLKYKIVFKTPLTRGKILARLEDQFALSFREPYSEYGIDPVVFVSFSNKQEHSNRV